MMNCSEVDLEIVDLSKTATWNIYWQFGIDIEKDLSEDNRLDVTGCYIPAEEQQKLIDYMIDNNRKLKSYKFKTKKWLRETLKQEQTWYFPTTNNGENNEN